MAVAEVLAFRESWTEDVAYGWPTTRPLTRTTGLDEQLIKDLRSTLLKARLGLIAECWIELWSKARPPPHSRPSPWPPIILRPTRQGRHPLQPSPLPDGDCNAASLEVYDPTSSGANACYSKSPLDGLNAPDGVASGPGLGYQRRENDVLVDPSMSVYIEFRNDEGFRHVAGKKKKNKALAKSSNFEDNDETKKGGGEGGDDGNKDDGSAGAGGGDASNSGGGGGDGAGDGGDDKKEDKKADGDDPLIEDDWATPTTSKKKKGKKNAATSVTTDTATTTAATISDEKLPDFAPPSITSTGLGAFHEIKLDCLEL
ncbi:hypothetical protein B0T26DRAFT_306460 [Lasiosphaeria miniovina]|uniref:Uncharacterized protein n=1 Tax=Lasiosphaeria miniovina TaxID=1954250 RepID=A0AA40DYR6_9PEZI|nr:uncharacterized protein B0T26DRAFT_306460 [Lasiosphaeria miniovina]KAK0717891.1 hypothetical protein B0T26DRAFT_306460 [Lasiosphaeria miniovina]